MLFSGKSSEGGLLGLLRKLSLQVVSLLETRAELVVVEFREEKIRLVKLFIWLSSALFLMAIGLVMLTLTILFAVWQDPQTRLWALGIFTLVYIGGAAFGFSKIKKLLVEGELPFAETINQLKKDKNALHPRE